MQWQRQIGVRRTQDWATALIHTRHNRLAVVGEARAPVGYGSAGFWLLSNRGDSLRSVIYLQVANSASGAKAIAEAPNGDFLLLGRYDEGINGQNVSRHFLIRTDSLGTMRWVRYYHTGVDAVVETNACVALPDGGALLVMTRNDPAGSLAYPIRVPTIMRVDAQGQIVWDRTYGQPYSELRSIVPLPDGSYALAGDDVQRLTNPVRFTSDTWVLRIDLDGTILRSTTYPIPQTNVWSSALRLTADGSLLVVGSAWLPAQPNRPMDGLMLQLDPQDRVAWRQLIASPNQTYDTNYCWLHQVWPLPTPGQFVVIGSRFYANSTTAGYGYLAQYAAAPGGTGAAPVWEVQYKKYETYPWPYAYVLRPDHTLTTVDYGLYAPGILTDLFVSRFTNLPAVYEPDLCATPPVPNAAFTSPATAPDSLTFVDLGTAGPQYAQLMHWRWTLGDGTVVEQTSPAPVPHHYATPPAPGTPVTLTITNNLGCSATQTLYPWGRPTATQQARALAARATLFPNPAAAGSSAITLALPGLRPQPPVPAELLDALGRVVRRFAVAASPEAQPLPLGALPAGVYALRLHPTEGSFTKRLVVQ